MSEKTIVSLRLATFGDTSPALFESLQRRFPTANTWAKGERNSKYGVVEKSSGIEVLPPTDKGQINDRIVAVLSLVEPHAEEIRDFATEGVVQITCVIYFEESFPALNFSPELISQIAGIGASLDIDVYPM